MKKLFVIALISFNTFLYSQNDSISLSTEIFQNKIDSLNTSFIIKFDSLNNQYNDLKNDFNNEMISIQANIQKALNDSLNSQKVQIDELNKKLNNSSDSLQLLFSELNKVESKTNTELTTISDDIDIISDDIDVKGTIYIVLLILIVLVSIFLIRKKFVNENIIVEEKILSTRKKLENANLDLDKKLIELYNSQLKVEKNKTESNEDKKDLDHSLSLKVADEMVRMEKNLSFVPNETKGKKQLERALERIKDTFKVNGYDMIDMIGKPYKEGMKATANFIIDDTLSKDENIITRIIKPQVNYKGVMIQSAEIEVSTGE